MRQGEVASVVMMTATDLGEEGVQTVHLLSFFHKCVVLQQVHKEGLKFQRLDVCHVSTM